VSMATPAFFANWPMLNVAMPDLLVGGEPAVWTMVQSQAQAQVEPDIAADSGSTCDDCWTKRCLAAT